MNKQTFELEIPETPDNHGKGIYHHQLQALLRRALSTYIEFGHIDHEEYHDEDAHTSQLLLDRGMNVKHSSTDYHKDKNSKACDIFADLEKRITEECNGSKELINMLGKITAPIIRDADRWKGVPLWSISNKAVALGDGLYQVKFDKDIDSSG